MPRFSYAGALLAVVSLLLVPISAQISDPNRAPNAARVQHVIVRGTGPTMEVEIQTSGAPVAPDTQCITGPDRIVVDFPGALPAPELRALKVNRGALKRVRAGLFFDNPPITRIVLDLEEPQSYRISTMQNAIVVKLSSVEAGQAEPRRAAAGAQSPDAPAARVARLRNAALATDTLAASSNAAAPRVSAAIATATAPPPPLVTVTFENGM